MIPAGYIADHRCPTHPEHGIVLDYSSGGYFCPHAEHNRPKHHTKNFWTADEFQTAKSLPTPQTEPNGNTKVKKTRRRR